MNWLKLYGGGAVDDSLRHVFSRDAEKKARQSLDALEQRIGSTFDGAAWIGQRGFTQIAVGVEIRVPRRGERELKSVVVEGSQLIVDVSCVFPGLETEAPQEIEETLEPVVMRALSLASERKELGPIPPQGMAYELQS